MKILFLTQIKKEIGLGHLSRSISLANMLFDEKSKSKNKINFIVQGDKIENKIEKKFSKKFIGFNENLIEIILNKKLFNSADAVVLDFHEDYIPKNFLLLIKELKNNNIKIFTIDSFYKYIKYINLIIVPSFYISPYKKKLLKIHNNILFGWDCFLIDMASKIQPTKPKERNILVLTGGSDINNFASTLPVIIDKYLKERIKIKWVVGPFSPEPIFPANSNVEFISYKNQKTLNNLMCKASFALTLYGVSFYELLYFQVPTVVFSPYGHQDAHELREIKKEKLAIVALNEIDAVKKLNCLISDENLPNELVRNISQKFKFSSKSTIVKKLKVFL